MTAFTEAWLPGTALQVRGRRWTLIDQTRFPNCAALRLEGAGPGTRGVCRTLLVPFDRPLRIDRRSEPVVVRARRWLHIVRRQSAGTFPVGGLRAAAAGKVELLPYQLEPALAMLRHGVPRLFIADAVGLGKTIQAALIMAEILAHRETARVLVVAPAGLLQQWVSELAARFALECRLADAAWLAGIGRDLPPGMNPWTLSGVYVASFDFLKQPEVLQSLEDARWDLVVADEAHAAALGTARRAAVHAVASRSARLVLLTATPPVGDPGQFNALCAVGGPAGTKDPMVIFQRSRAPHDLVGPRRTVLLPVRLTGRERRMHRLLEAYTARVWREGTARGDQQARLGAIVLRKRGLSSAASLFESVQRRRALLSGAPVTAFPSQPGLPLDPGDSDSETPPDWLLAHPGLADSTRERRWLTAIARCARWQPGLESKARVLLRLLGRLRRPVLIFTEFRDTLERLYSLVVSAGHEVALLHGGLSRTERAAALAAFEERRHILIATDAASEGLNLHRNCHVVVHYELPWNSARLEQRAGRLDRLGQTRRVHEILLVAADTAERLVLAPLARRARAGRASNPSLRLASVLDESRLAKAIMEGAGPEEPDGSDFDIFATGAAVRPAAGLAGEAAAEVLRLQRERAWLPVALCRPRGSRTTVSLLETRRSALPPGAWFVYSVALRARDGSLVARHARCVWMALQGPDDGGWSPKVVRLRANAVIAELGPASRAAALKAAGIGMRQATACHRHCVDAGIRREQAIAAALPSTARRLVQSGLFDRRVLHAEAVRREIADALLEDSQARLRVLEQSRVLTTTCELEAVLLTRRRGR